MYVHRILASAITPYVFSVPFNFIITTAVAHVPNMEHPVPVYRINGQARGPSLSNDKRNPEGFDLNKPRFLQRMLKPGFVV